MLSHPTHSFCFAELHTTDVDRSARFYGDVFGWTIAPVSGDFHVFRLDGKDIIGLRGTPQVDRLLAYICVQDIESTMERAQSLGAAVETNPFDTPGVARTCVLSDPDGGTFGLWEDRGHGGAHVQDRVGSMWWVELMARDIVDARHFYTTLFGWDFSETLRFGGPRAYTVFKMGDSSIAGAGQYDPEWGITQRWTVFFAIDDWDATVKKIAARGGEVIFWRDVPNAGRMGVILDDVCAYFIIMKPA